MKRMFTSPLRHWRTSPGTLGKAATFVASIAATAGWANAAAVIHESFAYVPPDTRLNGNTGGTGLAGSWTAPDTGAVEAANLSYGSLETSGSATVAKGFNASSPYIGVGATTLNGLLDDGGELWMSFLFRVNTANNIRFAIGLGDTYVTSNGDLNPAVTGAQAIGFAIPYFPEEAYPVMWTTNDYDGGNVQNAPSGLTSGSAFTIGDNTTYLFVLHAQWNANGTLNDSLTLYTPGTDLVLGSAASTYEGVLSQDSFDTLFFTADQTLGILDEIRVGATYASVTPIPEPSSSVLLGSVLSGLLLRRRRCAT